jgi:hypothetical protein
VQERTGEEPMDVSHAATLETLRRANPTSNQLTKDVFALPKADYSLHNI